MIGRRVLLLNASNMVAFPVYPYAFVQVPAIARQSGVEVICKDLLGVPQPDWEPAIRALIERHDPAMILITLRNTDSLVSQNYEPGSPEAEGEKPYFPVERTRALIATIRTVSDLPVTVGGFGFSVMPEALMPYLRPDWGVFGGPEAFFAHLGDIEAGHPAGIPNLLYFRDGQLISNPRVFDPPLADTEYTPRAIEEMMAFYAAFPSPGFDGAPVEVMRGCNHRCVFCSEPHVKGAQVQYRDLSAVMADIELLVAHGITQIHMISSELNPEGNGFALRLAGRIRVFNEREPEARQVTWSGANYLLGFSLDEYEQLYSSGFTGGWFDVTAFDDDNARAMRTPYRNERLLAHLRDHARSEREQLALRRALEASQPEAGEGANGEEGQEETINWTMFLGNPASTVETIRNTLRTAGQEGLSQLFDRCHLNVNIRVFDYEEPTAATLAVTYSVTPDLERTAYQPLLPSFAYPPALLQAFGSEGEIADLFGHIAETYLSTRYRDTRDWLGFVQQRATAASLSRWLGELPELEGVPRPPVPGQPPGRSGAGALQELFVARSPDDESQAAEDLARQVAAFLLSACLEAFPGFFESLGLPSTAEQLERMAPYDLAVAVYSRWDTEAAFLEELAGQAPSSLPGWAPGLLRFCAQAMLYRFNVLIRPGYRGLFLLPPAEMQTQAAIWLTP